MTGPYGNGLRLSILLAGAWLTWWLLFRPATEAERQQFSDRLVRSHGVTHARELQLALAAVPDASIFDVWRSFMTAQRQATTGAFAVATATPDPDPE